MVQNYFVQDEDAERYNQFRPSVHPELINRIAAYCAEHVPFKSALDVGCGTGHSTYPLQHIATYVTGIDPSLAMLAQTRTSAGLEFINASAEALPFPAKHFDLITVGLAFHWFEQSLFLKEAARVLKPDGWLVVYNSWMTGVMVGVPAFTSWVRQTYLERYPSPPRRKQTPDVEKLPRFNAVRSEDFELSKSMNVTQLAGYLTTQSNIIQGLLGENIEVEEITAWLETNLQPFFVSKAFQDIQFGCRMTYFQYRAK